MMNNLKASLIFGVILLCIDIPWIYLVMTPIYKKIMAGLNLTIKFKILGGILAYLLLISIYPLLLYIEPFKKQLVRALILGIIVYGVYAFTLYSFHPNYPFSIALLETAWGGILLSITTLLTQKILTYLP